jgi:fibronectin-binding autotransporter adhesin
MKSRSTSRLAHPLAAAIVALLANQSIQAADGTWGANANSAWYTVGNWVPNTQFPGSKGAAASNTNIATFTSAFTGTSVGINMNATAEFLNLGAISVDSTRTTATTIGNSTTTVVAGQVLRLYGATVNSVSNVVLRNAGTGLLTLANTSSGGNQLMGVVLSNTTDNIINIDGTGGVTISSIISQSAAGNKLTKGGSGSGILTLSGANTYTGATTITSGVLATSTMANGGSASGIGQSTNAAANLVFGAPSATLRYTGTGNSTNRGFTLSSGASGGATIEASGTGALSFDNIVAIAYGTTNETRTLTLGGTSINENNFGKALADNGSGATSLVKTGAGTWILSATNNYTGGSTVSEGALAFRTLAAKSGTGTHAFAAGTTIGLGVGGSNFTTTDVDNAFSAVTGHSALAGNLSNVTVTSTTNVGIDTTAGNLAYNTNIGSVTKGLTKFGANTLTLGGSSGYTGATTVVEGTLAVPTLTNAGANSSIGNFATAGATGLNLLGGTFSYTGASTTTDRGFTVTGAAKKTITVGTGVSLALGASVKNETASSTNGLTFSATGAGSSITISSLTINAGSNPDFNISTNNPTVTIQNLNVTGANVIAQRTSGAPLLNVGNINGTAASGWLSGINVSGVISGYTGAIILGDSVTLSGLSTFDTSVAVQQGGVYTFNSIKNWGVGASASALGAPTTLANGTIAFGNGSGNPIFRYNGTGDTTNRVLNLRGSGTLNLEQAGTGLLKFTGNTTADTGNTGAKILNFTGSTAGTGEFSGNIVEHTSVNKTSVSKSGTGTWTLSGANTYTGTTVVNAGILQFSKQTALYNNNLASWTAANINVKSGATLAFNVGGVGGFTDNNISSILSGLAVSSSSTNGMNAGSRLGFDTTNAGGYFWIGPVIADTSGTSGGVRSLIKLGAGTLELNNNTYTGVTTLAGGTLSVSMIGNGGMAGGLGAATNDSGNLVFDGGTLEYTGISSTSDRAFTIIAGKTATITSTNDISFAGATGIASIGALTKAGSGALTLTGTNTYTGTTTVSQGKLVINGSISTSSLTTVAPGATLAGSGTLGKTVVNGTLSVGNSPGTMTFTDALTLAGATITEIDGTAGAGQVGGHDFVNLTGAGAAGLLSYGGTMTLDIGAIFGDGFYSWNLFDMVSESGTFTAITLADKYSGSLLDGDLNGVWDLVSGTNTWQFTESTGVLGLTVVPEPRAALLGGLGLLALLRRRRNA